MDVRRILVLGGATLAAGCVPAARTPPQQPPQQLPAQQPVPPPPPTPQDWRDMPLSPGGWVYSNQGASTQALFGTANSAAAFIVRCDRPRRQVFLSREGTPSAAMLTIRTSNAARNLPASIQREPMAYVSAAVAASDPILDSIAFSRGRFTVEAPGLPMLVIPAWPEPARVVEDCRG
ncbi:MAG TPA: hypothetical protein VNT25_04090 [Allosphingosinicella sp.]|nr:hypothetical protein [Allosphingosinicella sp.]